MAESSARRSEGNAVAAERTERDRGRCVLYKQGGVWGEERGQLWAACRMVTAWDWIQYCMNGAGNKHVYTLPAGTQCAPSLY